MYAVIVTGGKQYKVAEGEFLKIEKLEIAPGETVSFDRVLLVANGEDVKIGAPVVDGAKVEADPAKAAATKVTAIILEQFKGEKQLVFKFKKRKNYKKLRGHRQQLTRVQIESVGSAKADKPAAKKAAKKDDADKKPAAKKPAVKKEPAKKEAAKKEPAKKPALKVVSG